MLRNRDMDLMHEPVLRARILADHSRFFDQMDFRSALFYKTLKCQSIRSIAVQTGPFSRPAQCGTHRRFRARRIILVNSLRPGFLADSLR